MRIGVDARELSGRATGVGRYLGGLLRHWAQARSPEAARHEFVLYSAEPIAVALDARRFATRLVLGPPGTWWEQVRVPRAVQQDHLDVWFAPGYTAPLLLTLPIVVAVHDVSFAAHPEWFGFPEGLRRRWLTRQSAERSRAVITISQFSKREIVQHLGTPESRIHVIPPGVETRSPQPPEYRVPSTEYRALYVGTILNRRHVTDLIRAFAPIAREHRDASLDIVGDNRSHPREDLTRTIANEALEAQVRWHDYATEDELRNLYARARVFAFLSEYEGLGMTPLEALAGGVPPLLLDTPVARESCGDAALYVPANDMPAVTRALDALLFDESTRARVLAAAPGTLARYSWARAARETLAVLEGSC
ncbi:MAG TPA: glycosyltransferase family 1 protein [Vicinamibacterales bacterium]|nr:glycosyltransferase family 1 protein [Vicinamibacterales bacterium]